MTLKDSGRIEKNLILSCQTGVVLWQHKLLDNAPKLQASLVQSDKGICTNILRHKY